MPAVHARIFLGAIDERLVLAIDADDDRPELASSNWKRSDALAVTSWFQAFNKEKCANASKDGDKGQFVEVVRLLKAFARSRPSWKGKISNGFVISKLVADHWAGVADRDVRTRTSRYL